MCKRKSETVASLSPCSRQTPVLGVRMASASPPSPWAWPVPRLQCQHLHRHIWGWLATRVSYQRDDWGWCLRVRAHFLGPWEWGTARDGREEGKPVRAGTRGTSRDGEGAGRTAETVDSHPAVFLHT